jgi:thiol:disulfide interchange protein
MLAIRRIGLGSLLAMSVLAVLAVPVLAGEATEAGPTLAQFDEALARAQAENKPVVLDFFTDW